MGVSKHRGNTKMDGENNGKPYEQMDDLGGFSSYFWKHPYHDIHQNSPFLLFPHSINSLEFLANFEMFAAALKVHKEKSPKMSSLWIF